MQSFEGRAVGRHLNGAKSIKPNIEKVGNEARNRTARMIDDPLTRSVDSRRRARMETFNQFSV